MKATSVHIVLLAIFMYGVLSTAYLYGQTKKSPTSDLRDKAAADSRTVDASTADNDKSADYHTIHVKYASVEILAKQLKDLLPATTVAISDDRTSQIIIRGPKEGIEMAESLIKDLDIPDPTQKNNFGPMGPPLGGPFNNGSGRLTLIGPPGVPGIAVMGNANGVSAVDPNGMPNDMQKAWEAYAKLTAGNEELIKKDVLKDRELLNQLRASGEVESATKVLGVIQHLLQEQSRRAEESAKRADEQAQQAKQEAQKAETANDDQQRQAADQARRAADDARRSAEQVRRTIEELQHNLSGNAVVVEQSQRRNEEIKRAIEASRRAMEAGQQIAAISASIRNLESSGDLSDKQKSTLDEAKRQLKDRVSTQFDERQKQESEELKQLRQRLDKLEKSISDRAQNREKIINQQIDELTSASSGSNAQGATLTSSNLTMENLQGVTAFNFVLRGCSRSPSQFLPSRRGAC